MMDKAESGCATPRITGVDSSLIGASQREHNEAFIVDLETTKRNWLDGMSMKQDDNWKLKDNNDTRFNSISDSSRAEAQS